MNARRPLAPFASSLLLLFAACGGGGDDSGGTSGSKTSAPPAQVKVDPAPAAEGGAPVEDGAPASIRGTVLFAGTPPERKELAIGSTAGCCPESPPRFTEAVIVEGDKLVNVIVSIQKVPSSYEAPPVPEEPHLMHQKCCIYSPHVSAVRAGQEILVANDDETSHNVHVYAKRTNVPNRTQGAGAPPLELSFDKAEAPVRVGCDIHPWMKAWIGVFNHPFYAVTGADGSFSIEGLPPGKYTLTAWHEELGKQSVKVELPAGGSAQIDFTYKAK